MRRAVKTRGVLAEGGTAESSTLIWNIDDDDDEEEEEEEEEEAEEPDEVEDGETFQEKLPFVVMVGEIGEVSLSRMAEVLTLNSFCSSRDFWMAFSKSARACCSDSIS